MSSSLAACVKLSRLGCTVLLAAVDVRGRYGYRIKSIG
jgi:hypothetical protein